MEGDCRGREKGRTGLRGDLGKGLNRESKCVTGWLSGLQSPTPPPPVGRVVSLFQSLKPVLRINKRSSFLKPFTWGHSESSPDVHCDLGDGSVSKVMAMQPEFRFSACTEKVRQHHAPVVPALRTEIGRSLELTGQQPRSIDELQVH